MCRGWADNRAPPSVNGLRTKGFCPAMSVPRRRVCLGIDRPHNGGAILIVSDTHSPRNLVKSELTVGWNSTSGT